MGAFPVDIAVVAFTEFVTPEDPNRNEVEILIPVIADALASVGFEQKDIDFTVSGSADYLQGQPFAFVAAVDALGAWPPIRESHLEMDGAFALYEAMMVLAHGDAETALVYAFGRPSRGDLDRILALQLDPYLVAPQWPDARDLAGLQAQAMRDSGKYAAVPEVPPTPVSDGGCALILVKGDRARQLVGRPAWITGIDHRIESQHLGQRDLSESVSTRLAAHGAGVSGSFDASYVHSTYPHQTLLVLDALQSTGAGVSPVEMFSDSGPMMAAGLSRIGHAARGIWEGKERVIAHAQSGACMQQNLVAVLASEPDAGQSAKGEVAA